VDRLLNLDTGFDPENIFILWKGIEGWEELNYPVIENQVPTTTTTNQSTTTFSSPTTAYTITLTKTATIVNTIPAETSKEQIQKAVLDLFVPEFKPVQAPIPILLTVTNPIDSQWTCDIPITFTDMNDETNVVIWMINVTLDAGETREVLVEGIAMDEARWEVRVGFKTSIIFTS